jgi:hypoxanthine phosphoribosyltransferase
MNIDSILISEAEIKERVAALSAQISRDYAGKRPFVLCVLKGAWIFHADLVRAIDIDCEIGFIALSSYGSDSESKGKVEVTRELKTSVKGLDVIVVEDILDSGHTLNFLLKRLKAEQPASLKLCVLLDKPERRETEVNADYVGFQIPNRFVVGYGLDYAEQGRGLPYVATVTVSS